MNPATYAARLRTIDDHQRAWRWGAITATDMYLLFQSQRTLWSGLTDCELEAWADRVNAYMLATAGKTERGQV